MGLDVDRDRIDLERERHPARLGRPGNVHDDAPRRLRQRTRALILRGRGSEARGGREQAELEDLAAIGDHSPIYRASATALTASGFSSDDTSPAGLPR